MNFNVTRMLISGNITPNARGKFNQDKIYIIYIFTCLLALIMQLNQSMSLSGKM